MVHRGGSFFGVGATPGDIYPMVRKNKKHTVSTHRTLRWTEFTSSSKGKEGRRRTRKERSSWARVKAPQPT